MTCRAPTAAEVLEMLANWLRAKRLSLSAPEDEDLNEAIAMDLCEVWLDQLDPVHVRTLATALSQTAAVEERPAS
jgi:hypothetical protein